MANPGRISIIVAASLGAFALLLLIISVGTVTWLDDGYGNTIGLFRKCYGTNITIITDNTSNTAGCYGENRVTQGGLSVFGLLLLAFGVIAVIASLFVSHSAVLIASIVLFYFSSMFVMAAYATWGVYTRDVYSYAFPQYPLGTPDVRHTNLGGSYNLCVAAHYFLWTALTALAFGAGYAIGGGQNQGTS